MAHEIFIKFSIHQQLGYIVFSGVRRSSGVQGLRVIVQSDRHPNYVEQRVEAFIEESEEFLANMSEEEFLKHRAALAAQRLEKPKRMSSRASQLWGEISAQVYNFERAKVEVEQLNTVSKSEMLDFFKKHISAKSTERRKLSVYVISTAEGGAGYEPEENSEKPDNNKEKPDESNGQPTKICDLVDFKARRRLYPHPAPFTNIPRKGQHCKL